MSRKWLQGPETIRDQLESIAGLNGLDVSAVKGAIALLQSSYGSSLVDQTSGRSIEVQETFFLGDLPPFDQYMGRCWVEDLGVAGGLLVSDGEKWSTPSKIILAAGVILNPIFYEDAGAPRHFQSLQLPNILGNLGLIEVAAKFTCNASADAAKLMQLYFGSFNVVGVAGAETTSGIGIGSNNRTQTLRATIQNANFYNKQIGGAASASQAWRQLEVDTSQPTMLRISGFLQNPGNQIRLDSYEVSMFLP